MRFTSIKVFLLLFLGNDKCTEQGGIIGRSFTHHLYSMQLVKHSSLILSLFHDSVERFLVKTNSGLISYKIEGMFGELHART